jgi:RNA polymerase sigma-70 factor (ECF subfamily)
MPSRRPAAVLDHLRQAALQSGAAAPPDGELLECFVARREEDAFEALVRRHGPMVLGVCRRVLQNDADAEDAFQATFLVLARKAASVRPRGMVGNWLHGVARNTALRAKAMNRRRRRAERAAGATPRRDGPADGWADLPAVLDEELAALPEKYRAPIVLCELEGRTIREASRQLGWPQGTVATRLSRGRAALAARLTRRGLGSAAGSLAVVVGYGSASAAVPAPLVVATVEAATAVAAGPAAAAGVIPDGVAALTEGVVKAMLVAKLKVRTAALLAVLVLGAGGGWLAAGTLRAGPAGAARPPAGVPDEKAKPDKDVLQGTWVEVSRGKDGEKLGEDRRWQLVFDNDKVTVVGIGNKDGGRDREGTFTLDPDKKPKEIDLTLGSLVLTGIYELKGTTLKTLWRENDRSGLPADFDASKGILIVFEKKKK